MPGILKFPFKVNKIYLLVAKVVEITVCEGTGVTTILGGSVETKAKS